MSFWRDKSMAEMSSEEWELLCDGCGRCCMHKLENEDTGTVYYTRVACRLLDRDSCRCGDYPNRVRQVPDCVVMTPDNISEFAWLPESCAYRRLDEGRGLAAWHPLVSGDPESVHRAGISVRGGTLAENEVDLDNIQEHVIHWFDHHHRT